MEVRDRFTAIRTIIDDNTEPGFGNPEIFCNVRSGQEKMPEQSGILGVGGCDASQRPFGDDENVGRSLGVDVPDGKTQIILMKKLRWNFPCSNLFKKRHRAHVSCK